MQRNIGRLRAGGNIPQFWLPLADAGGGAVNLGAVMGIGSGTFTRNTNATCWGPTGLLLTVTSGVARATYAALAGAVYLGYYAENAATNLCLQNRDLTQAGSWTALGCTPLKDQVGIDGAANSASSLTATAPAASCLQTITEAATNSTFSCYVKRITGVGTITIQQTGTTTDITALINSSTYTLVTVVGSILNPLIGFNIATSGDAIAVDYCQFENAAFPTSPIATTTVAVTRNADQLIFPTSGNVIGTEGTFAAQIFVPQTNAAANAYCADLFASRPPAFISTAGNLSLADGTGTRTGPACPPNVSHRVASTWSASANGVNLFVDGTTNGALAFDGDMNVGVNVSIGGNSGTTQRLGGAIQNFRFWTSALSNSVVASL